ncbi:hypothetical protein [Pseudomonas amygdali]|uniref:hypothetical protein n=1 Tax=Pseudomonas amygdali TaxID=47877 RepID=UPI0015E2ABCB|nr:hypothetical protein [Pseudomonas amygdali]
MPSRRRSGIEGDDITPDQACLFFDLLGIVAEGIHGAAPVGLATRRFICCSEKHLNIYSSLKIYLYLDADRPTGQAGAHLKNQKTSNPFFADDI